MAASAPPGDPSTPLYDYSDDLAGAYDGGLATAKAGSSCAHSYPSAQADDPQGPSKWSVHAWSTGALPQPFHLDGQVTVSLFTATVGGVERVGPALRHPDRPRPSRAGFPSDRVIGAATYDLGSLAAAPCAA